ncbi:DUF86 domain-containing protein [Ureibacillus sp. FSL K6-8385]|uniref:DUF86 domain-containing protein n=1 Tax=Ureibacillus terrenus TaxID=118246 RepID=A0A540V0K4_9BACL|nr:DUF86 domain-containing protein [Ureibacillus terrenus]MED3662394.1 DUF86 domain-containing protein [Ureibacillus terrenus]MED3763750.1 DUF86 domain-containing protein [Ureibacillus terrenus]TQE90269.1 DUF86 domain-containing protein [Ureibacillus terrenus]
MYFVDRKKIVNTLAYLDEMIAVFEQEQNWLENDIKKLALERIAHNALESVIDVGNLMIDGFIMRDPGSYDDIIDILIDEKVIPAEKEQPFKELISLRKNLVREFIQVDIERVYEVLKNTVPYLKTFSKEVTEYLENELGPVSAFLPEDRE